MIGMIDVIKKIRTEPNNLVSVYAEVTVDSMHMDALHIGCGLTGNKVVVFNTEIDALIRALQELRGYL